MLKSFLFAVTLLTVSAFANDAIEEKLALCEKNYDQCSVKCEDNESTDFTECISTCEKDYYLCQTKVEESLDEKQDQ
ncbi:MAG: hypothetical protein ACNI25_09545 [Halarcobacter sp.]